MPEWDLPDGPVTIMFTDVEGSTALNTLLGDRATRVLLRGTEDAIRAQLESHGGHEVKGTGDGHLVWFASARRGVACAVAIQQALVGSEVRVRIGLSTGEVTAEGDDIFGEAVNLAARVAAKANGGEIVVAEVVRQLTGTLGDASYKEKGRYKLKGFPERARLFTVEWADPVPLGRPLELPFVGRASELGVLRSVLDRTSGGRGGIALLEGEGGIGKTRLAAEAVAFAERRSATVLRGVAADLDRTRPFRAMAEALDAVVGSNDPKRREIAELLRYGEGPSAGHRIQEACIEVVEALAMAGSVLLVLEDLHWADPSTLQVLSLLIPSTTDLPLAIVATLRPSPRSAELRSVLDQLDAAGCEHLHLGALGHDDQLVLAASSLGRTPDEALIARLDKTAGNPLYVIELARAAESGDLDASRSNLRSTILSRLSHLPESTIEALRLASVLGSAFKLADLAAAAGESAVQLVPILRPALTAQVIVETSAGLSFRHDLIRESLYEDLPVTVRKALHAEIGRSLAAAGADSGLVAAHLVQGVDVGDEEALTWIVDAARKASGRSITAGIELLEQALALCRPLQPLRNELEADLVAALAWTGQPDRAIELARAALARHPAREGALRLRRALGEVYVATARRDLANQLGRETLGWGVEGVDRARFLVLAFYSVATSEAADRGREARELAAAGGDELTVGAAHLVEAFPTSFRRDWATLDEHLLAALDAFERAGAKGEWYRLEALAWRAWMLEQTDREEEGALVRREARRRAEELGAEAMLNTFDTDDAMALLRAGRLNDARAKLEAVVARQEVRGSGGPDAHVAIARIAMLTGDPDTPRLVERVRSWPSDWPIMKALYASELGDHEAALDGLLAAFHGAVHNEWAWPAVVASPPMIRTALALGRPADVEAVVVNAEREAAVPKAPSGARAIALWCRGLVDRDPAKLREALGHPGSGGYPLERAFVLEDLALALEERGARTEATAALLEALAAFEALDLSPSVTRVAAHLHRLGVRTDTVDHPRPPARGWESITPSEWAIVDLVVRGLTNPQISKQLYVSRHTVDSHLKSVYVKLDMSSRVELAGAVARRT